LISKQNHVIRDRFYPVAKIAQKTVCSSSFFVNSTLKIQCHIVKNTKVRACFKKLLNWHSPLKAWNILRHHLQLSFQIWSEFERLPLFLFSNLCSGKNQWFVSCKKKKKIGTIYSRLQCKAERAAKHILTMFLRKSNFQPEVLIKYILINSL